MHHYVFVQNEHIRSTREVHTQGIRAVLALTHAPTVYLQLLISMAFVLFGKYTRFH